jgi:hypothetical protein
MRFVVNRLELMMKNVAKQYMAAFTNGTRKPDMTSHSATNNSAALWPSLANNKKCS